MVEVAKANPRILSDPEPVVWITAFGERAVEHELRYWISDPEAGLGNIQGDVFLGIWDRFGEAGIRIPYPRQDVRIVETPERQ
jgi:small-conductance mechanosensitive channel